MLNAAFDSYGRHSFAHTGLNHYVLREYISTNFPDPSSVTVYSGEFSDGAHNWGFSQNFGTQYPDKGFRMYADKINSYFYSPEFFERIHSDNTLSSDVLVQNFLNGSLLEPSSSPVSTYKSLFRISLYICSPSTAHSYFSDREIVEQIHASSISPFLPSSINECYSSLINIYKNFHWQGSTVIGLRTHDNSFKPNIVNPYGSEDILSLLETMPTSFGRGLEILPAKYPLKWTLENRTKYPFHIQTGPHSYVYDDDQSISLIKLSLLNTSIGEYCFASWLEDRHHIRSRYIEPSLLQQVNTICETSNYADLSAKMCNILFVSFILDRSLSV